MLVLNFNDHKQERALFVSRAITSGILMILCVIGILLRLIWLQVKSYEHFRTLSQ